MSPRKPLCAAALALLSLAAVCRAEIPPGEARGLYASTDPAHRNLSPLWGMAALESGYLANLRFFGNYGSIPDPRFPHHPALDPADNCPLDATAAVLQYLFPSPDGANFVLNQRSKDPIGEIAQEQAEHRPDPGIGHGLRKITALLDAATDYRQRLAAHPEAEEAASREFRTHVDRILAQAAGATGKAAELRDHFARLLQQAVLDETRRADGGIYPPDIVEVALLAYAWMAADHANELYTALAPLLTRPEHLPPPYDAAAHGARAAELRRQLEEGGETKTEPTPEEVCLFLFGTREFIPDAIPSPLPYGTAHYGHATYPDCGETSLRNFFNIVLARNGVVTGASLAAFLDRCPRPETKEPAPGHLAALAEFYRKRPTLSEQHSQEARDAWSEVVSNLNRDHDPLRIDYRNGTHNLAGTPGLENMLNLIAHLLPDPTLNRPWSSSPTSHLQEAGQKLDALCALASRDGFRLDWTVAGHKAVQSRHPSVRFTINGTPAFIWTFALYHYSLFALDHPAGLHGEGEGAARYGGFWAQAWWRRLRPSPYWRANDWFSPNPEPPLTSLRQVLSENPNNPTVALQLVDYMLASPDSGMALTPTFGRILARTVPDLVTILHIAHCLSYRTDLEKNREFYPLPGILRWSASVRNAILVGAAGAGDETVVKFMIDHGADVNAAMPDGDRPIFAFLRKLRQSKSFFEAFEALLAAGADPNFRDARGRSPLDVAIASCHVEAAEALMAAGADPFRKDALGNDAVALALRLNRTDILQAIERRFPAAMKLRMPGGI